MNFIRAYRIVVGDVDINALDGVGPNTLRIAFQVERDHTRHPSNAEVAVWGMSPAHREALAKLTTVPVRIEAGYADDAGVIFQGDLRSARTKREGPDLVTRVSAGDGESKIRTARISRTFARGTPVGDVIGQLGKALGVSPGNLEQFRGARLANGGRTLTRALTLTGSVFDELERVCRSAGLDWSVQSGALQLRTVGAPVGSELGPLLRRDTGLIGDPETERAQETKDGILKGQTIVTGQCLMRADLVPGRSFRVEHANHTGNLVCRASVAEGDSHGDSWFTNFTGVPY